MLGGVAEAAHLVRRFFGYLAARPLTPREQRRVRAALSDSTAGLFFRQHPADQRHALEVADRVAATVPARPEAVAAALLHDVGKLVSGLGPIRRSLATILGLLHLPMPARYRRYLDHGALGAAILEEAGAPPLAVAFSRHHPGPAPAGVDPGAWAALGAADGRADPGRFGGTTGEVHPIE